MELLLIRFNEERKFFDDLFDNVEDEFLLIINKINEFSFKKINLELTEDKAVFFKINLGNNRMLYIKFFFEIDKSNNTYFGYYEGEICVRNGIGSMEEVLGDLRNLEIV